MTNEKLCIVCGAPAGEDDECYGCDHRIHATCLDKRCLSAMGRHRYTDHLEGSNCGPCADCVDRGVQ